MYLIFPQKINQFWLTNVNYLLSLFNDILLYTHNHNDINTTVQQIHIQILSNTKHRRTPLFRFERFINFKLRFFDTRRETILKSLSYHTMLITPQRSANLVVQSQFLNTRVGTQLLNTMVRPPNFSTPWSDPQLLNTMVGTQLLWFFQNFQNSQPISSGHNVIHTPAPFLVWGLLWQ